jgi:F-type H+-transporting ATPase subunit a
MQNLFSTFDSSSSIIFNLNWLQVLFPLFFLRKFWLNPNQLVNFFNLIFNILIFEIKLTFSSIFLGNKVSLYFISLFIFIVSRNVFGLFPYIFTASRHISLTLFLSLPLWVGVQVHSWLFQTSKILIHLTPSGTPLPLIPFLVVIERLRNVIRPFTLAIRLIANITAGHLLLCLLGGAYSPTSVLTISMIILLLLLECGVALIQAYVFTLLSSLYTEEALYV